jgi:hypothetical protein
MRASVNFAVPKNSLLLELKRKGFADNLDRCIPTRPGRERHKGILNAFEIKKRN